MRRAPLGYFKTMVAVPGWIALAGKASYFLLRWNEAEACAKMR
jgi:hypothetical protein